MLIQTPPPPPPAWEAYVAAQSAPSNLQSTVLHVVARGPSPGFGAGIIMPTVLIIGRTDDGASLTFYVPFMQASEPLPAPGARCTFHHQLRPIEWVGGFEKADFFTGQIVWSFECDNTSSLPVA